MTRADTAAAALEARYGPGWRTVEHIRGVRTDAPRIAADLDSQALAPPAVWHRARNAAEAAGRRTEWYAVLHEGWEGAPAAVRDAARAAIVHDLIGQYGYTLEDHFDLTAPWRRVFDNPWELR